MSVVLPVGLRRKLECGVIEMIVIGVGLRDRHPHPFVDERAQLRRRRPDPKDRAASSVVEFDQSRIAPRRGGNEPSGKRDPGFPERSLHVRSSGSG